MEPTIQLKQSINRIKDIFKDNALTDDTKKARVNEQVSLLFDFREMSKLMLRRYWDVSAPARQNAFVEAFSGFLGRVYFPHLDKLKDANITYLSESTGIYKSELVIQVQTKDTYEITIFMHMVNGIWKIYDMELMGISIAHNYGEQFRRILRQKSFDDLIRDIGEKKTK